MLHYNQLAWKRYEDEVPGRHINAIWTDTAPTQDKQYVVETPPKVLERCLLMTTDPGDLVLDLTCGSGAMPFQAEKWGRRWIAVDVAQVSMAITRERLITNTYPYHILKDSPQGAKLDHELEQELYPTDQKTAFVPPAALRTRPSQGIRHRTPAPSISRYTRLRPRQRRTYPAPRPNQDGQNSHSHGVRIYR